MKSRAIPARPFWMRSGGLHGNEADGKTPRGGALLIVAVICALSVLGAYLVRQFFGQRSYGEYTMVTLTGNEGVQVSGNGFIYYNGSTLASVASEATRDGRSWSARTLPFDVNTSGVAGLVGQTLTVIGRQNGNTLHTGRWKRKSSLPRRAQSTPPY